MLRGVLVGLTLLHLGPGLAFAVLAFGCDPLQPLLGPFCAKDVLRGFGELTLASWVALAAATAIVVRFRRRPARAAMASGDRQPR